MFSAVGQQLAYFAQAVAVSFTPMHIAVVAAATIMGIIVGAVPGLTATMALALLINLTYSMEMGNAIAFLLGVYIGAVMGGCYSAIMINIPGTPSAAATALDGFVLARQGNGGRAVGAGIIASFVGSTISILILLLLTPFVYRVALKFGHWENFLLAVFGIMICGNLSTDSSPIKGWIVGFLGFFTAMIGLDAVYSFPRFTFGSYNMMAGISLIPALIGVFGISEILIVLQDRTPYKIEGRVGKILPDKGILKQILTPAARSGVIGSAIGAIPGAGEDIAAWVAYDVGKRRSKNSKMFGKGSYEGLASAETANNACVGGAMIPLLTLAVPGSPPAAMFLAAIMLHGVKPGPMLAFEQPTFLYQTGTTLFIATVCMLIFGLLLVKPMVSILKVNRKILMPIIVPLTVIGAYAGNVNPFDIFVMFIFGIIGYILRKQDYPMAPLVLGIILGPNADIYFRQALMQGQGSILPLLARPVGAILIIAIVLIVISGARRAKKLAQVNSQGVSENE
ncbi:MAG: tripartite tricarboxylate transporter permease [Sphaerochaetaceae bacterium]|nr:tripartite tricarboxylate transporter permease [Sphaerochaetaceae bacterium]